MTRISMKPITDRGWLLLENGERLGLVSQTDNGYSVMGGPFAGTFPSMSDLERRVGRSIIVDEIKPVEPEPEKGNIEGYPVRHGEWHDAVLEPIPTYTRTAKSTNRYGAGYYALKFPHGWTAAFCPKLATLLENEYMGPFRTKLEMQHQISANNKIINV